MKAAVLGQSLVAAGHISVIPPDLDDLGAFRADGARDAREFFYPTSDQSYKNNDCIYAACRVLRDQGVTDFTVALTVDATWAAPNVVGLGRVPRAQVLERLSRATLIFASLIETCGLPLAEARALGALVLAADLSYAREVLDGYDNAHYFDPAAPEQLADLMRDVLGRITRHAAPDGGARGAPSGERSWDRVMYTLEWYGTAGERGRSQVPGRQSRPSHAGSDGAAGDGRTP